MSKKKGFTLVQLLVVIVIIAIIATPIILNVIETNKNEEITTKPSDGEETNKNEEITTKPSDGEEISPKYFAFGTPTTESITDYTTLGKNVFATLYSDGTTGGVCINDNGLFCIKTHDYNNSAAALKAHFGESSCTDDGSSVLCYSDDVFCSAHSHGNVNCHAYSTGAYCIAYADGSFFCSE